MVGKRRVDAAYLVFALVLLGCVFLLLARSSHQLLYDNDVGSQLAKGYMVLEGLHPFIDVDSSVYGPAIFYLSALAQWVDGQRLISEVTVIAVGYLIAYLFLFWTFLQRSNVRSLFVLFLGACVLTFPRFHKYHVLLAPAVYLACLHYAAGVLTPVRVGALLGAGSAIAGVLRLDYGAYCALSSVIFIALRYRKCGRSQAPRAYAAMFGTGLVLVGPWLVFLASSVHPLDLVERFSRTALGVYVGLSKPLPSYEFGQLPFAPPNNLIVGFWLLRLTPLCALVYAAWSYAQLHSAQSKDWAFLVAASLAATLFFLQASHRIGASHLQQVAAPVLLVGLLAVDRVLLSIRSRPKRLAVIGICTALAAIPISAVIPAALARGATYSIVRIGNVIGSWTLTKSEVVEQARRPTNTTTGSLAHSIRRVRELTQTDEYVLFLPYASQAYYFADRLFETPFGWLNPGRFLSMGVEEEFVASLASTSLIVDQSTFRFDGSQQRDMRSYAPLLTRHIYESYRIFEIAGAHVLLSNRADTWRRAGRYAYHLVEDSALGDGLGANPAAADIDTKSCPLVTRVSTLPTVAFGCKHRIARGGGLVLDLTALPPHGVAGHCDFLAMRAGDGFYVVADADGDPVEWRNIGGRDLIDTQAVPAGSYDLVRVRVRGCENGPVSITDAVLRFTNVVIELH